jgi:hypothetical protein
MQTMVGFWKPYPVQVGLCSNNSVELYIVAVWLKSLLDCLLSGLFVCVCVCVVSLSIDHLLPAPFWFIFWGMKAESLTKLTNPQNKKYHIPFSYCFSEYCWVVSTTSILWFYAIWPFHVLLRSRVHSSQCFHVL